MTLTPTLHPGAAQLRAARTHSYEEQEIPVGGSASRTPQGTCRASRQTSVGGLTKGQERQLRRACLPDSPRGRFLDPDNLYHRVFLPVLAKAGIRKIRLHDLRHTFGSQLLQNGASIVYVKEQMGHSSIQVTVDIYGHLIPGANVCFVDRLDEIAAEPAETTPQQSATPAQLAET